MKHESSVRAGGMAPTDKDRAWVPVKRRENNLASLCQIDRASQSPVWPWPNVLTHLGELL